MQSAGASRAARAVRSMRPVGPMQRRAGARLLFDGNHCPAGSGQFRRGGSQFGKLSRNACVRSSLCPYRPLIFCSTYSSTFRRTPGGMFGDERMRLMTMAVGPALLSKLSNAQAVLRDSPRTAACLAVVSHPAAINASRISASFEASLAFAGLL
jgi:hypothetical protein